MGRRRGLLATLVKISRDAERAARRRQRELEQRQRAYQRMEAVERKRVEQEMAEVEVETFENTLDRLLSVHRESSDAVNWKAQAASQPPPIPVPSTAQSDAAKAQLHAYKPGFFVRLLGLSGGRKTLEEAVALALRREEEEHRVALEQHREAWVAWQAQVELAGHLLAGDTEAYADVIADSTCLAELEELGCEPTVTWPSPRFARVALRARQDDVVPLEEKRLGARGKVSVKKMPAARRMEIYQDYVCGVALRAARELLAVLPLDGVLCDVGTELLNPGVGHFEPVTVLSVYCPREGMARVNFDRADASDTVERFVHAMAFKRGKGFSPVEPLDAEEVGPRVEGTSSRP